jgi:hypothetical protein
VKSAWLALLPLLALASAALPNVYVSAGSRRDGPSSGTRVVPFNLSNTGPVRAEKAQIDSITGITVLSGGPGPVSLLTTLPAAVGTVAPGKTVGIDLLFAWPSNATRIRLVVAYSAGGGTYKGSSTLTLNR